MEEENMQAKAEAEKARVYSIGAKGGSMRVRDLLKLSVRAFKVRPMRTFLTILGMSVGIGTVFFLISLGYGLQYILLGKLAPTSDSLTSLEAYYPEEGGLTISSEMITNMKSFGDVAEVSPVAEYIGDVGEGDLFGSAIVKVVMPSFFRLSGTEPDVGEAFKEGERGLVISSTALKLLGWPEDAAVLGKELEVRLAIQGADGGMTADIITNIPVRGVIADEVQAPFVYIPDFLLAKAPESYARMYVKASSVETVESVRDDLVSKGFLISARIDLVNQAKKITTIITAVLGVFGVAALVVSAIGMFNTMLISFMERIFEVGIMKSLGATQKDIRNLFLVESLMMGVLGGVGGILIGFLAGQASNLGLNILARYLGGKSIDLFIYPFQFVMFIIILSGIVGVLSGFWPARRAAHLSAREAFLRK